MIKSFLWYGLSTGINRCTSFIFLPLLATSMSISEVGLYSLVQAGVQLLNPIIALSGSAAIVREGLENPAAGYKLLREFSLLGVLLGSLAVSVVSFFDKTESLWLTFTVVFSALEAIQALFLAWIHCLNYSVFYLITVLFKSFIMFTIIILSIKWNLTLREFLFFQLIGYMLILIMTYIAIKFIKKNYYRRFDFDGRKLVSIRDVLPYVLPLIPHAMSQWIMSSSDRFIIKTFLTNEAVGIYSLCYTIAFIIMLVNSGVSMSLPVYIVKNHDLWKGEAKIKFIKYYSIIVLILGLFIIITSLNLNHILTLMGSKTYSYPNFLSIVLWISAGLYLMGIYYLYSGFLIYHKKTNKIAIMTLISSIFNVIITIILVPFIGIIGAAIATFLSYLLYLYLIIIAAINEDSDLQDNLSKDLLPVVYTALIFVFAATFSDII